MRLVILESPFAGDVEENILYARLALRDSLLRGEAPTASHLLYTQPNVLDDRLMEERRLGIEAGLAWEHKADATVVYIDRGISKGMLIGLARANKAGRPVEYRSLNSDIDLGHIQMMLEKAREEFGEVGATVIEFPKG